MFGQQVMWDINGFVVVITGAGGAIGRELAIILRRDFNCHLALCDMDEGRLKETLACVSFVDPHKSMVNMRTTTHVVDVSNRDAVMALADDVHTAHGRCEIVFNNAGVASAFAFDQVGLEEVDKVMHINLGGMIHIAKAFMPLLKASERSALVNTSSILGLFGFPSSLAYCMSKFGVTALSQCLAMESAEFYPNVHICSVHPGFIRGAIIMNSKDHILPIKGRRSVELADVDKFFKFIGSTSPKVAASQMIDGIRRGQHRVLIGSDAKILDVITRLFPNVVYSPITFKVLIGTTLLGARLIGRKVITALLLVVCYFYSKQLQQAFGTFYKEIAKRFGLN